MDGGTVEQPAEPKSFTQVFEKDCPYFMSLGMTYEQYWFGNPLLVRNFLQAEEYRRKQENYNLWLNGLYMQHAIASTIGNAFLEKGASPNRYPEKPFAIDAESIEKERQEQEEKELEAAKIYMQLLVDQGKDWWKKRTPIGG